jgi:hypothetical protein
VKEHDRPTPLIPRFYDVELNAPATGDFMSFHANPPTRTRCQNGRDRTTAIVRCLQSVPLGVASTEDSGEDAPDSAAQKNVHISLDDLGQPDRHAGANTCELFKERIGSR